MKEFGWKRREKGEGREGDTKLSGTRVAAELFYSAL